MDREIVIAILSGVGGTVVGVFATQLGTLLQNYREDKRMLNRLLYQQLKIWAELKATDLGTIVPQFIEKLRGKLILRGAPEEDVNRLVDTDMGQLVNLFAGIEVSNIGELTLKYNEALIAISDIDPILAYDITGNPEYEELQNQIDMYMSNLKQADDIVINDNAQRFINEITIFYKDKSRRNIINWMEKDMIHVSGKIHYWTKLRLKRLIKQIEKSTEEKMDKLVEEYVDLLTQLGNKRPEKGLD